MPDRPYILLSCGMSIDGYRGSASPRRHELSNNADFDWVDAVRASCDAVLVGAATVRNDSPRLLVRSKTRRDARTARGLPASPIKATVTERVELDPRAEFFTTGDTDKLAYSGEFVAQHERRWPLDCWITRDHARLTIPGGQGQRRSLARPARPTVR